MAQVETPGCFFAVVGPSGAGKDSLIDAARDRYGEDGRIRFVRRVITRPVSAGGEDHIATTVEAFQTMEDDGQFALSWRSHGLCYGIPSDINADLAAGRSVLANLSRSVIGAARSTFVTTRVVVVTAPAAVLASRLAARGRESAADIEERLRRAPQDMPSGPDVRVIDNGGALEDAVQAFMTALEN